ncbi:MAG: PAS domain-containing protein [Pseudomonadota bacterium]
MGLIRQPLIVLDSGLMVLKANYFFYQAFDIKPEETEGQLLYDLGNRQWDIPKFRELFQCLLSKNSEISNFRIVHEFATIGRKILLVNARRIERKSGNVELILLSIEDVTVLEDQKRALEELVDRRTRELVIAKIEAEEKRKITETALAMILQLQEQLAVERAYLQEEIKLENNHETIIGQSDALKDVLHKVRQIASSNTTVL